MNKALETVGYMACIICMQGMFRHFFRGYYVRGKSLERHFQDYRAPTVGILIRDAFIAIFCISGGIVCLAFGGDALIAALR